MVSLCTVGVTGLNRVGVTIPYVEELVFIGESDKFVDEAGNYEQQDDHSS